MYNFPATKWVGTASIGEQVTKIGEEYLEVVEIATNDAYSIEDLAEETADIIQACETLLRIIEEGWGVEYQDVASKIIVKNMERDYYGEQQS